MEELHKARKREKHYWNVQTMQSKKRLRVVGFYQNGAFVQLKRGVGWYGKQGYRI
jgi:hypothetical protein